MWRIEMVTVLIDLTGEIGEHLSQTLHDWLVLDRIALSPGDVQDGTIERPQTFEVEAVCLESRMESAKSGRSLGEPGRGRFRIGWW